MPTTAAASTTTTHSNYNKVIENNNINNKNNIDMRKWHWPQHWKGPTSRTSHSSWSACSWSKKYEMDAWNTRSFARPLACSYNDNALATHRNARFTRALQGIHSLARSITFTQAHGKVVYDNWTSQISECIADRPTNQPANWLTNQPANWPTNQQTNGWIRWGRARVAGIQLKRLHSS